MATVKVLTSIPPLSVLWTLYNNHRFTAIMQVNLR